SDLEGGCVMGGGKKIAQSSRRTLVQIQSELRRSRRFRLLHSTILDPCAGYAKFRHGAEVNSGSNRQDF
ncbi:MAG: hypothetical protein ABL893_19400, partial [Hyphomicrobium sp.]